MRIFLSYASNDRAIAEKIASRLELEDHVVFFDREGLQSGKGYDQQIRQAIEDCDLMIFLISPDAVAGGRYTLTELSFAKQKWRNVNGRVLPVLVRETTPGTIPAVLSSLQIVRPVGNLEAEVVAKVARIAQTRATETHSSNRPPWIRTAAAIAVAAAIITAILTADIFRPDDSPATGGGGEAAPPRHPADSGDKPIAGAEAPVETVNLTCELTGELEGCDLTLATRICAAQQQTAAILNGTATSAATPATDSRSKVYLYGFVHSSDQQDLVQLNTLFRTLRNQIGDRAADPPGDTANAFLPGPVSAEKVYDQLEDAMLIVNSQLLPPYFDNGGTVEKRDGDSTIYFGEKPEEFLSFTLPRNNFKSVLDLHRAAYFYSLAQHTDDYEEKMNNLDQAREFISNACKAK